ncbi:glycine-rich RNA-binding protein 3, mitochondrial-like [Arachis duranensis]|uniref:Glycine-rich RNA-binding protein 3, mitochondrial-like n=1 Tax=Arachis duranensis TaxID=130453 RepID=A0A9C6TNN5_ARADU|nr:glycine-rich RNA-binding protein 3, mitochondrial-like [Arachis duranensis]XP_052117591.1 glycine-rich RNA-binding protein 3, mitochondrial-like [Arachis duranensis]
MGFFRNLVLKIAFSWDTDLTLLLLPSEPPPGEAAAVVTTTAQENPPQQGKERVSYSTNEQSFREVFGKYGDVVDARIIVYRDFGRSRGFGFITYSSVEEASSAIQALDGQGIMVEKQQ